MATGGGKQPTFRTARIQHTVRTQSQQSQGELKRGSGYEGPRLLDMVQYFRVITLDSFRCHDHHWFR